MLFKLTATFVFLATLSSLAPVKGAPTLVSRHDGHGDTTKPAGASAAPDFLKQNGLDAQKLNVKFAGLKATDACTGTLISLCSIIYVALTVHII